MDIIDILRAEHRLLRQMMSAVDRWLTEPTSSEALHERAVMLAVALEDHAAREERLLLDPLRSCAPDARRSVDMMEVVHDEVRGLFDELANSTRDPHAKLWTILQLTDEHFVTEEEEVFPLARARLGPVRLAELTAQDKPALALFAQ